MVKKKESTGKKQTNKGPVKIGKLETQQGNGERSERKRREAP